MENKIKGISKELATFVCNYFSHEYSLWLEGSENSPFWKRNKRYEQDLNFIEYKMKEKLDVYFKDKII